MPPSLARRLNALGLLGLSLVLAIAFFYQFALGELPCPLCLLQRLGFIAVGVGILMNVTVGPRPSHYGVAIVAALAGAVAASRQMLLHIAPGSGEYGSPLFGLHFYTWAFLGFVGVVLASAFLLLFDRQFLALAPAATPARAPALSPPAGEEGEEEPYPSPLPFPPPPPPPPSPSPTVPAKPVARPPMSGLERGAVVLFFLMALANAVSAFSECAFGICPADPVSYELFKLPPFAPAGAEGLATPPK